MRLLERNRLFTFWLFYFQQNWFMSLDHESLAKKISLLVGITISSSLSSLHLFVFSKGTGPLSEFQNFKKEIKFQLSSLVATPFLHNLKLLIWIHTHKKKQDPKFYSACGRAYLRYGQTKSYSTNLYEIWCSISIQNLRQKYQ